MFWGPLEFCDLPELKFLLPIVSTSSSCRVLLEIWLIWLLFRTLLVPSPFVDFLCFSSKLLLIFKASTLMRSNVVSCSTLSTRMDLIVALNIAMMWKQAIWQNTFLVAVLLNLSANSTLLSALSTFHLAVVLWNRDNWNIVLQLTCFSSNLPRSFRIGSDICWHSYCLVVSFLMIFSQLLLT